MRQSILCLALCAAFSAFAPFPLAHAQTIPSTPTAPAATVDQAAAARAALQGFEAEAEKIRADWNVPGVAIAIVKGDQIIYAKGHGLRDVAKNLPMSADTLLPIGSSTKAFTTAVLATLVDEGKLDWNKPVHDYLPTFKLQDPVANERVTPLDLVTHRTGMPRHDALWYNAKLSRAEMVRRLQFLEPSKDFRTDFQYNNAMFLTAGYLSEVVSGQSWEDNVRTRLFAPLGMKRANFAVEQSQQDADFAQPYDQEKDGKNKQIPFRSITNVGPAGSINASVNELAAWMQMHLNHGKYQGKQVLAPASVDFVHTPRMVLGAPQTKPEVVPVGYAPGWFVDVYRGHLRVHHGGNIDGFSAMVMLVPGSDLGIAVLTNLNHTGTPDLIARRALDRLLNLEQRDWSGEALKRYKENKASEEQASDKKKEAHHTNTKPSHALAAYVGEYEHPGYGSLQVTQTNGKLNFVYSGVTTPLEHWHYDVFNAQKAADDIFEDEKLQFGMGIDGEINNVQISLETAVKPIVFSKKADSRLTDPAFLAKLVGQYAINANMQPEVSLRGSTLSLTLKGQPTLELVPLRGTRFGIKGLTGFFVDFKLDAKGMPVALDLDQPNGIFTAKRK
jgi:CubicO group peptidase (beta-lactamase class C family)